MRAAAIGMLLAVAVGSRAMAQTPAGAVSGVVTDAAGSRMGGVTVRLTARDTGQARETQTSADGEYGIAAVLPATYLLSVDAPGFKRMQREVQVDAGSRTVADLTLTPGDVSELVTVSGLTPLMRSDDHYVGGVVTRAQIDNLPLNGRNFLDLAKLEPGVSNPVRGGFGRTFISVLGSGLQTVPRVGYTRVTVDGGSIMAPVAVGTFLQVSQEAVQEFQLSSASFDPSTGLTTNGAVNIVTRSGGSAARGDAFDFFRDHHLSAYPALKRSTANPDPFFQRAQYGGTAGGPLRRDRVFFFATFERSDDRSVAAVQTTPPEFSSLRGIFPSPSSANLGTVRVDAPLGRGHGVFVRYTLDRNSTFSGGQGVLPSGWSRLTNRVGQTLVSLTTTLGAALVNDLRASRFALDSDVTPAGAGDCANCLGLGMTRTTVADAGVIFGRSMPSAIAGTRYQLSDVLARQKDRHRLRAGFDWEHSSGVTSNPDISWTQMTVSSPSAAPQSLPLPALFTSVADIWRLPLKSYETTAGSAVVPWSGFSDYRRLDVFRVFAADSWHAGDRVTVNAGLGWSLEPNGLNTDLSKPDLLAPLLGAGGLHPPRVSYRDVAPGAGIVWAVAADRTTLVRAGIGRYIDPVSSTNLTNLANERLALLPLGVGRLTRTAANFPLGNTTTGAQFLEILPGIQNGLLAWLDPSNRDFTVRNVNQLKQGMNLYDPAYRAPASLQLTAGVQRQLPHGIVITADAVVKRFTHTFVNGIDYNRYDRPAVRGGPVIAKCSAVDADDRAALCSNGNFFFDTTIGRARYTGLLVRVEKRFDGRFQLLASYTYGSYTGTNGTGLADGASTGGRVFGFNNDNWYENDGPLPTDIRQMLNLSGVVRLPWGFQASLNATAYSRPPFSAYVAGIDFNGDGTRNDLLPGTTINAFNRSMSEADLRRLVDAYNLNYAGQATLGGQTAPGIALPASFSLDDRFFTADLRLSRSFAGGRRRTRLTLLVDVFNVFNVANVVQFSGNLRDSTTFGQPGSRFTQLFGSGGPRAIQLGARIGL
jgi:carboxypeptidase family protein